MPLGWGVCWREHAALEVVSLSVTGSLQRWLEAHRTRNHVGAAWRCREVKAGPRRGLAPWGEGEWQGLRKERGPCGNGGEDLRRVLGELVCRAPIHSFCEWWLTVLETTADLLWGKEKVKWEDRRWTDAGGQPTYFYSLQWFLGLGNVLKIWLNSQARKQRLIFFCNWKCISWLSPLI